MRFLGVDPKVMHPIEPHSFNEQEDNCLLLYDLLLAGITTAFSFTSQQKKFGTFLTITKTNGCVR